MLRAYMDESGTHAGSPALTVAAYVGEAKDWRTWTKKWNAAKRSNPKRRPIKVYHATDAEQLRGEFEGWTHGEVGCLVQKLLLIMNETPLLGVVIGIQMNAFRAAMDGRDDLNALFGNPYVACFQWLVSIILHFQGRTGNNDRIGFIHECNDYQHEALNAFNWVAARGNPQGSIVGIQFGTKESHTPLQAADILAFEGNKRVRDPGRPERRPWTALSRDDGIFAAHYGADNMGELIQRLEMVRDGRVTEIDLGSGWNRSIVTFADLASMRGAA